MSLFVLLCSCGPKNNGDILLTDEVVLKNNVQTMDEIFGENHRLLPLETSSVSLIGNINKIIRKNDHYYVATAGDILRAREILIFDQQGRYVNKIDRAGRGPDEYNYIGDFDVVRAGERTELWICYDHYIKVYNADNAQLIREIELPFVVYKLKKLYDDTILLMTSQNDEILTLIDQEGNVLDTSLPKEYPFTTMHPVQFRYLGDRVIYQLGKSNRFAFYDVEKKEFGEGDYVSNSEFLSPSDLLESYERYGVEYLSYLAGRTCLVEMVPFKDALFLMIDSNERRYMVRYNLKDYGSVCCEYNSQTNIMNDINGTNDLSFISTLMAGESDAGLLMILQPGLMEIPGVSPDANPVLLEYF